MSSPLGQILAAGLVNSKAGRSIMTESIEQAASHVVHDLERYLSTLGTIAAITPLLGLLGTVFGMIRVFSEIMAQGTGNANALAGRNFRSLDYHGRRPVRRHTGPDALPDVFATGRESCRRPGKRVHQAGGCLAYFPRS